MTESSSERPFTVYLAGPMKVHKTDPEDPYGFQKFHEAAKHLRSLGVVVLSPAETAGQVRTMPRSWYFRFDFAMIQQADAVVVLPQWQWSTGAVAEVVYATELGIPLRAYHPRTGLGAELVVHSWEADWEMVDGDQSWRDRIVDDPAIRAPVEAFP